MRNNHVVVLCFLVAAPLFFAGNTLGQNPEAQRLARELADIQREREQLRQVQASLDEGRLVYWPRLSGGAVVFDPLDRSTLTTRLNQQVTAGLLTASAAAELASLARQLANAAREPLQIDAKAAAAREAAKRRELAVAQGSLPAGTAGDSPAGRAPGWSRGQQLLSITYDECVGRAKSALQSESYRIDHAGGNFAVGVKEAHTAVIMCNPVGAKEVVNIVVMSNAGGGGDQRGRLQARMEGGAPPPATATTPDPVTLQPQPHAKPAEPARPIDWTTSVNKLDIPPGQRRAFTCSAIDPSSRFSFREREGIYWFPVWGTDIYETDSHICPAAVHAGIISFQSGGTATLEVLRSNARINGSKRNGIGSYTSFREKDLDSLAFRFVTGASARVSQGVAPQVGALPPLGPDRDGWTFNSSTATNLRFFGSASAASCRVECEKDSKCVAFSWIKPAGYQPGDPPMCYLLSSWAGLVEHPCCISAVRN